MVQHVPPVLVMLVLPPTSKAAGGPDSLWSWSIGYWTVEAAHKGETVLTGGVLTKGPVRAHGTANSERAARAAAEHRVERLGLRKLGPGPFGGTLLGE